MSNLVRLGMFQQDDTKDVPFPYTFQHIFRAVGGNVAEGQDALQQITEHGHKPILTLEPWDGFDRDDLREWAAMLDDLGAPVILRYAHEMNGTWYPWCIDPDTYVKRWRAMARIMTTIAGPKVSLCWCPNIDYATGRAMAAFYPGGDVVDYLGLDMYCTDPDAKDAESFKVLATRGLKSLDALNQKLPKVIVETGCGAGKGQVDWVRGMFKAAMVFQGLESVSWFDAKKDNEPDYRITANPATLVEFVAGAKAWDHQWRQARFRERAEHYRA